MSDVTRNQPYGTPTWIDLDIPGAPEGPAADRAREFYGALFGWEYRVEAAGHGITCLLRGRPVAGFRTAAPAADEERAAGGLPRWRMYFATDDCDATARRITEAGGTVTLPPSDIGGLGRAAFAEDPGGSGFGLWQGKDLLGCELVNEPGTLVRNDLSTPAPGPARTFYAAVFDFTLDGNKDLPDFDFTFLRRPDGHEIGGVFGAPDLPAAAWETTFEVADTDAVLARATAAGGSTGAPSDTPYGRMAQITDPLGTTVHVIARPPQGA